MKKTLYLILIALSLTSLALALHPFLKEYSSQKELLAVGGGTPPSAYSSTLTLGESSTDTTIDVASVTAGDTALTTGNIYPGVFLTIEPQTSSKRELVFCTGISSLSFTGCTRGLSSVGSSMAAITANQQSHQAGVLIIASDPAQFYSHILLNRWEESWINGKHHEASATSSDRTGFSLGNGQAVDIRLIFKDDTATSTAPQLYRQESTGNLIWSGNGVDEITLGGTGASSTCGRGTVCEAVNGGNEISVATSTDTNSANLYGLSFITESSRGRLRLSGNYFGDFTINNLFASSTNASSTSYFSHLVPGRNNGFDLGSPTSSWRGLYASGTVLLSGSSTISNLNGTTTTNGLQSATHNGFDVGIWGNAFRNIFASGTIYANSLSLASPFNTSSTIYSDSIVTFATSTTGLYAYYHQATSTFGSGPLSFTVPIPGDLLGVNSSIRVTAMGSSTRLNPGGDTTVSVTFGGTTFASFNFGTGCKATAPGSSCTTLLAATDAIINWHLTSIISNRNSKSIQTGNATINMLSAKNSGSSSIYKPNNPGAVNTSNNQDIVITAQSTNVDGSVGFDDMTVEILNGI